MFYHVEDANGVSIVCIRKEGFSGVGFQLH